MSRLVPVALALLAAAPAGRAAGPFDPLLPAVPPQVNTLVMVNVKAAYASPLAQTEKWADDYYRQYKSGVGFVPPDAEAVVVASQVNLSAMTRDHQVGLVKVTGLPTITGLADREGGTTTQMGGLMFALSPRDVYYTTLDGPPAVVAVYPADRQATARWARHTLAAKAPDLPAYLKQAADAANKDGDVLTVAVDLTDSQDPTLLKLGLAASPAVVRQQNVDIGRVARFIALVRGLTFTARVGTGITGTVRVDFGDDPAPVKRILRELFLELLDEYGVAVAGMEQWETTYGPTSMTLSGPLATPDLRRVFSLFAFPGATAEDAPKITPGQISEPATYRYWGAVNAVLGDLRATKDAKDFTKTATWYDKAAAQLDQLNRQGVDPIAQDAAAAAAKRVRAVAASLRGVPIDLKALDQSQYYTTQRQPYWGWGGWWNWRAYAFAPTSVQTNIPQVRAEMARVVAADEKRRVETWGQIDQLMSDARRKLSDKYPMKP